jgi:hypothetical protein
VLQTIRNVAIIALLALGVTVLPGGGAAAETMLNALGIAFLAAIAWFGYTVYRRQELTLATMSDGRRAVLFGSVGLIALLIAGYEQFRDWGDGAILGWILLLAGAIVAIFVVWREATTYS